MRCRPLLPLLAVLALPATASAQAEAPADPAPVPTPAPAAARQALPRPLVASGFTVSPKAIVAGARPARVLFRLDGGTGRPRVRVELVRATGGKPVATLRAGRRRTGRLIAKGWSIDVPAGRYVARLRATDAAGTALTAAGANRAPLTVKARRASRPAGTAPVPATVPGASPVPTATPAPTPAPATPAPVIGAGPFPIRGAYSFGDTGARFGAGRPGHVHQGQDVFAAEGTPIVSPAAGTVYWRAVQDGGAGHYLVIRSSAGPDYVFMHLVAGSETVAKGDRVAQGQVIAAVGHTGRADGSHLHFELWPDGWYAQGSSPIDPLPQLKAWAAGG